MKPYKKEMIKYYIGVIVAVACGCIKNVMLAAIITIVYILFTK